MLPIRKALEILLASWYYDTMCYDPEAGIIPIESWRIVVVELSSLIRAPIEVAASAGLAFLSKNSKEDYTLSLLCTLQLFVNPVNYNFRPSFWEILQNNLTALFHLYFAQPSSWSLVYSDSVQGRWDVF